MSFILESPRQKQLKIAAKLRTLRVLRNFKRQTLSQRSGVSEASIKRFERTGEISLRSLLQLALVLDALDAFDELFEAPEAMSIAEMQRREERLKKDSKKKRGRL
ncbi:MAG: helix-turn-helix domain-containing protein [Oligoflexales bacterium]|nr:helix-turn-helix domain-containing protein [Oligoflexales bacterium]